MKWLVAASAAVVVVIAMTGLAASQLHAAGPLDPGLISDAERSGATIDQSLAGTAECTVAAPLPDRLRVGPIARCAGIISPTAALAGLRGSAASALAIGLADASWSLPCPLPRRCSLPAMRRHLDWVIQVDTLNGLPGPYLTVPSCTPGGKLYFIDARTGGAVMKVQWGWGLVPGRQGAGC